MTGWQNQELNISEFAGKKITLKFLARDVGDSAYDSAILLDDVFLQ